MEECADLFGRKCRLFCKVMTRMPDKRWFRAGMKVELSGRVISLFCVWIKVRRDGYDKWVERGE